MKEIEIAVIGAGPAGLCAALSAASLGAQVTLFDRKEKIGGQLVKQTHKFFGSKQHYASQRGIEIPNILFQDTTEVQKNNISFCLNTWVLGYYSEENLLLTEQNNRLQSFKPQKIIVATGASENMLAFPNNDLPGIYGAGAVQTLMNEQGVLPGKRVLMVGAGNIGLIVSYQLAQAGAEVVTIVDAAPHIGGYLVHAAKVRRLGIPILTSHTIKEAYGDGFVEGAVICELDQNWEPVVGTERDLNVDVICISVGLSPLADFLWRAGCKMKYVPTLGGYVPLRSEELETSVPGIYVAGDVAGVEEASAAMVEGRLAGICAARSLGYGRDSFAKNKQEALQDIEILRSGPRGEPIKSGLQKVVLEGGGPC